MEKKRPWRTRLQRLRFVLQVALRQQATVHEKRHYTGTVLISILAHQILTIFFFYYFRRERENRREANQANRTETQHRTGRE